MRFLEEHINEFNFATTAIRDARGVIILLRDADRTIHAGLSGHTWGGVPEFAAVIQRPDAGAELDALFVEPHLWKHGIGRLLVDHVARIARVRAASFLHVSYELPLANAVRIRIDAAGTHQPIPAALACHGALDVAIATSQRGRRA
jgi:GNAT superfamily N-acetyltransferase